jgi:acyl carrier protein
MQDLKPDPKLDSNIRAVIALVAQTLEIPEDTLGPDSSMLDTPPWESVEHLNICLAFEQRFGRTLDMDAISTATSIRALAALVPGPA